MSRLTFLPILAGKGVFLWGDEQVDISAHVQQLLFLTPETVGSGQVATCTWGVGQLEGHRRGGGRGQR